MLLLFLREFPFDDFTMPAYKVSLFFWGIFLQALPFVFSGAVLVAVIDVFVGRDKIQRVYSRPGLTGFSRRC
jgi:uncharacterized membrane protein YraQ (UPF0718 family)